MLVIRAGGSGEYSERASRLVESLNRAGDSPAGTIKTDIFALTGDGVLLTGVTRDDDERLNVDNAQEVGKLEDVSEEAITALARSNGYSQVMVLSETYES